MALNKSVHEGQITDTYATEVEVLGTPRESNDGKKKYRFFKIIDAVDGAVGKVAVKASHVSGDFVATFNYGGTILTGLFASGFAIGTIDVSEKPYCWLQVEGESEFTAGSAAIIAGDPLKPDSAENGDLTEATTEINVCAIALETVADNGTGTCVIHKCW